MVGCSGTSDRAHVADPTRAEDPTKAVKCVVLHEEVQLSVVSNVDHPGKLLRKDYETIDTTVPFVLLGKDRERVDGRESF